MEEYIGRIRLSKEDSDEWYGNPPFVYVTANGEADRDNVRNAKRFIKKDACKKALVKSFKEHGHLPSSKMEVLTVSIEIKSIEEI